MLDFTDRTYAAILAEMMNRVPDTIDKREGSIIQTSLGPVSWYLEGVFLTLDQIQRNGWALTASGESLDMKVAERSITRRSATAAQREGVFNVQVTLGARFRTIGDDSLVFSVTSRQGLQPDGYYHATLTCETLGAVGNQYTGNILPITFISGLTYAVLTTIILAGTDEEDDESLRNRYLLSLQAQAFGGNIASYRNRILEEDDAGAVQVYPFWQGGGTVLCSVLDANFDRASDALIARLQDIICPPEAGDDEPSANGYGVAPIGAKATITTGTNFPINVGMTIELEATANIETVRPAIEAAVSAYFLSARRGWGNPLITNKVDYPVYIYTSRLNVSILGVEGVLNVTDITLNGTVGDLQLTETSELQQIPIVGTVTINAS